MRGEKRGYIRQLANYIKKNLSKGYTAEALKWALINQGYSKLEVNEAIKLANEELAKEAPKFIEKPVIKYKTEPLIEEKTRGFFEFGVLKFVVALVLLVSSLLILFFVRGCGESLPPTCPNKVSEWFFESPGLPFQLLVYLVGILSLIYLLIILFRGKRER